MSDIFISYSRKDKDFVKILHSELTKLNRDVWVDWEDIPPIVDWYQEIMMAIESTDNFIFILSSDAVDSQPCRAEIEYAVKHQKRLIPIVRRDDFKTQLVHPEISRCNWLFARESDDFNSFLQKLIEAIDTDFDYIRSHTRLQLRAIEWQNKKYNSSFLLRGVHLKDARQWLMHCLEKEPKPTSLHTQYITKSSQTESKTQTRAIAAIGFSLLVTTGLTFIAFNLLQIAKKEKLNALISLSESSFKANDELGALMASVKAGKQLQKQLWMSREHQNETVLALQQVINIISERNRLQGHEGRVRSISFSPDGQKIVSASDHQTVKLWSVNGSLLKTLSSHQGAVNYVCFSPDGTIIASASADKTVKLWNEDGTNFITLNGHRDYVNSVNFSPDGQRLVTASDDETIKIWKIDGTLLKTLPGHKSWVYKAYFSPDGKKIASASDDKTVKIWQLDGELIQTLEGHELRIRSVTFSPDGELIASASNDETVKLWKRFGSTFRLDKTIRVGQGNNSIKFSPDGEIFATANVDKKVRLWHRDGTLLKVLQGHDAEVWSVSFSPDGQKIASASADKTIKLWSREGILLQTFTGDNDWVRSVSFSPDSKKLVSGSSDKTVMIWDLNAIATSTSRIEDLLNQGCDWLHDYLLTNPHTSGDRHLCDQ